jgi:Protein of unknown function (DUF1236)
MNKSALLASTAVALVLCAASATAQMQDKQEKSPAQSRELNQGQSGQKQDQSAREKSGTESKGTAQTEPREKGRSGSTAQTNEGTRKGAERTDEPKGKQGTAQSTEPKGKQGTAERAEPKGKQGTAERTSEPKNKQGSAERNAEPKEKATKGAEKSMPSKDKSAGAERKGGEHRVQLSEQKRNNLHEAFGRERNVNRVTNVNFSINVGTRVPRTVRLAPLPVAIIGIVPEYRSYRYFEANDEICIVEPTTYEIVDVIRVRGPTVVDRGGARLVLSDSERAIILREVDMRSGSTLGLGALSEGADVPRNASLREFPVAIVDQIPKLRDYRFFTAEGRVAIVDPNQSKVDLVIGDRR